MLIVPLILAVVATAFDLKSREIPNTLPILLLVWAGVAWSTQWPPISGWGSLSGFAIAFGFGALSFRVGVLGGGDVKFLAALGGAIGPGLLIKTLIFTAIAGAGLAILALLRSERELAYMPAIAIGLAWLRVVHRGDADVLRTDMVTAEDRRREERGAALVEFALVALVLYLNPRGDHRFRSPHVRRADGSNGGVLGHPRARADSVAGVSGLHFRRCAG